MDEFSAGMLYAVDESTLREPDDHEDGVPRERDTDTAKKARTLRNGIFRAASLQDKLLEKYPGYMLQIYTQV